MPSPRQPSAEHRFRSRVGERGNFRGAPGCPWRQSSRYFRCCTHSVFSFRVALRISERIRNKVAFLLRSRPHRYPKAEVHVRLIPLFQASMKLHDIVWVRTSSDVVSAKVASCYPRQPHTPAWHGASLQWWPAQIRKDECHAYKKDSTYRIEVSVSCSRRSD